MQNQSIYRKHHVDGLVTSFVHPGTGRRQLHKKTAPIYYGIGLQGSEDFIGPRTQLHQALFDLGQFKKQMKAKS